MRWFFVLALSLWTLAAIAAPVVTFCLTRSPLSFSLFSTVAPPVYLWYRLATHLFPIDEKTFELKKLRIQTKLWNNKNFSNHATGATVYPLTSNCIVYNVFV